MRQRSQFVASEYSRRVVLGPCLLQDSCGGNAGSSLCSGDPSNGWQWKGCPCDDPPQFPYDLDTSFLHQILASWKGIPTLATITRYDCKGSSYCGPLVKDEFGDASVYNGYNSQWNRCCGHLKGCTVMHKCNNATARPAEGETGAVVKDMFA